MPDPTDQQAITALARACGWEVLIWGNDRDSLHIRGKNIDFLWPTYTGWNPLTSHDDAMAVQERLCGHIHFIIPFVAAVWRAAKRSRPPGASRLFYLLSISPADRCRALYAALPECGECEGDGCTYLGDCICGHSMERHCYETSGALKPDCDECPCKAYRGSSCPACDGTGKAINKPA